MKRYRDKISRLGAWHGILPAVAMVLLTLITFASCTDEQLLGGGSPVEPDSDQLKVQISVPQGSATRSGTEPKYESRLDSVTILVFNQNNRKLETALTVNLREASLSTSQPMWGKDSTLIVKLKDPFGPKKIYTIANWDTTGFEVDTYSVDDLNKEITTITDVAALQYDPVNLPEGPSILMSDSVEVANLSTVKYKVSANLVRQQAKFEIKVTLSPDLGNVSSGFNKIWMPQSMKVWVCNVPDQSFVVDQGRTPEHCGYKQSNKFSLITTDYKTWITDVYKYINQNMSNDSDKATYIMLQLPYLNPILFHEEYDNYYKIYFNTNATTKAINRNTFYKFDIEITDLGLPIDELVENVGVTDTLMVLPWENAGLGNVEDVPQQSFKIDRTLIEFQYLAGKQQASFSTNATDWKLIYEDGNNRRTFFSYAEGKISKDSIDGVAYTIEGNATNGTITVEKLYDKKPSKLVQQFYFTARNLKIPFKVGYDNGVILKEDLPESWHVNGIQITKRGNVLPSQIYKSDDPIYKWGTPYRNEWPNVVPDFGAGERNTTYLYNRGSDYQAARACRELGAEWYLPSFNELAFISSQLREKKFGKSYQFTWDGLYWCSTEYDDWYAREIKVVTGSPWQIEKDRGLFVRCIKNL